MAQQLSSAPAASNNMPGLPAALAESLHTAFTKDPDATLTLLRGAFSSLRDASLNDLSEQLLKAADGSPSVIKTTISLHLSHPGPQRPHPSQSAGGPPASDVNPLHVIPDRAPDQREVQAKDKNEKKDKAAAVPAGASRDEEEEKDLTASLRATHLGGASTADDTGDTSASTAGAHDTLATVTTAAEDTTETGEETMDSAAGETRPTFDVSSSIPTQLSSTAPNDSGMTLTLDESHAGGGPNESSPPQPGVVPPPSGQEQILSQDEEMQDMEGDIHEDDPAAPSTQDMDVDPDGEGTEVSVESAIRSQAPAPPAPQEKVDLAMRGNFADFGSPVRTASASLAADDASTAPESPIAPTASHPPSQAEATPAARASTPRPRPPGAALGSSRILQGLLESEIKLPTDRDYVDTSGFYYTQRGTPTKRKRRSSKGAAASKSAAHEADEQADGAADEQADDAADNSQHVIKAQEKRRKIDDLAPPPSGSPSDAMWEGMDDLLNFDEEENNLRNESMEVVGGEEGDKTATSERSDDLGPQIPAAGPAPPAAQVEGGLSSQPASSKVKGRSGSTAGKEGHRPTELIQWVDGKATLSADFRMACGIILNICRQGPVEPARIADQAFALLLPLEDPREMHASDPVDKSKQDEWIKGMQTLRRSEHLHQSTWLQVLIDTCGFVLAHRRVAAQGTEEQDRLKNTIEQYFKDLDPHASADVSTKLRVGAKVISLTAILGSFAFLPFLLLSGHLRTLSQIKTLSGQTLTVLSFLLRGGRPDLSQLGEEDRKEAEAAMFGANCVLPSALRWFVASGAKRYDSNQSPPSRGLHVCAKEEIAPEFASVHYPQPHTSRQDANGDELKPIALGLLSGYDKKPMPVYNPPTEMLCVNYWRVLQGESTVPAPANIEAGPASPKKKGKGKSSSSKPPKQLSNIFASHKANLRDVSHDAEPNRATVDLMATSEEEKAALISFSRSYASLTLVPEGDAGLLGLIQAVEDEAYLFGGTGLDNPSTPTRDYIRDRQVEFHNNPINVGPSTFPDALIMPLTNDEQEEEGVDEAL